VQKRLKLICDNTESGAESILNTFAGKYKVNGYFSCSQSYSSQNWSKYQNTKLPTFEPLSSCFVLCSDEAIMLNIANSKKQTWHAREVYVRRNAELQQYTEKGIFVDSNCRSQWEVAKAVEVFQGGSRNGEDGKSSGRWPNVTLLAVRKTSVDIHGSFHK